MNKKLLAMAAVAMMTVICAQAQELETDDLEMIETMTGAVRQFVGDTEQSDDLTMLAIKYRNMTGRACCG